MHRRYGYSPLVRVRPWLPLISMGELELSRVLLPEELTTEDVENVEEISRETSEMGQA